MAENSSFPQFVTWAKPLYSLCAVFGMGALATQFGSYAAKMVEDENYGITVAMKSNHVGENRLKDVAGKSRLVPEGHGMLEVARRMGISVG